nr:ABC transporter permease subunit [Ruthenibacterium lactatiformans]
MELNKKKRFTDLKKNLPLLALTIPGMLYLLINNYFPMFGVFIAFKDLDYSKGIFGSDWCGLKNFEFLFRTSEAGRMIRNTILYNLVFIILGTVLAVLVALLMSEITHMTISKFYQGSMILPNLISMVIVSYIVYAFLSPETGLLNAVIKSFGGEPISWYSKKEAWPFILVIVQMWKTVGYNSIVYIAAITGIDPSLYEAARIDGAGKFKQIFRVTLPQLKPMITLMILMSCGRIFSSDFGLFYQVPQNSGALYSVTQTIDTYVYRGLMQLGDVGMSSAAGLFQSVVGFLFVFGANAIVRATNKENALF